MKKYFKPLLVIIRYSIFGYFRVIYIKLIHIKLLYEKIQYFILP